MITMLSVLLACDGDSPAPAEPLAPPAVEQPAPTTPEPAPAPEEPAPVLTNTTGGASGLPDVSEGLPTGQCSSGPGAEGADSYFFGSFRIDGGRVTGTETWQLTANPKWAAKGGRDCSITWNLTGTTASGGGACGGCDLTVTFHATADVSGSACPEELLIGRLLPNGQRAGGEAKDFDQRYAIERRADGSARVYFAASGRALGEGYHNDGGFNYVTDHACKWF